MKHKDLLSINILRGIAAFGVYYYHQNIGAAMAERTGFSLLKHTDTLGSTFSVPLFFLISGYCIHLSNIKYLKNSEELDLAKYYKKRFWRIYPPYLLALICSVGVNKFLRPADSLDIKDLIVHFFSFQGFSVKYFNTINIVLWTISIELAFYFIYPVFYKIRLKYGLFKALAFTFVVSAISISYFYLKGNVSLPERFFVLNLWFAWCFGAFLCELKTIEIVKNKPGFGFFYLLFFVVFVLVQFISWNNDFLIKDELNVLIWAGPMFYLVKKEAWLTKFSGYGLNVLAAIGVSGYSLYLLHEPLILLKNHLISTYFNDYKNILMAICIFVIPAVCYLNYYVFERPFINFGKRKNI